MRIRYATTSTVDGTGIIAGQEAMCPFLVGAWYSGNEDMDHPAAADTAVLEGVGGNDISIEFVKEDVKAGSRKLKARFTLEAMQDAESQYGANVEQELTSALAQQIVLDIDQEILARLRSIAGLSVATYDQNKISGVATSVVDEHAALAVMINRYSNEIARKIRKASANWAVVSHEVLSVLQSATASQFVRTTEGTFEAPTNNKFVGTLNGTLKVYVNTYATDNDILIGYKGSDEIDAAAYYCPYVPVMCSGTILDPNTFEHVMAMSTRYGFFALTNPANSLGNAADYLARIKVENLRFI
jgi:tRNA(His) 5'-end guanylyltransferase